MKAPKVEVIRLSGFNVMTNNSICYGVTCSSFTCSANTCEEDCPSNTYCNMYCNPYQGYCIECVEDCYSID